MRRFVPLRDDNYSGGWWRVFDTHDCIGVGPRFMSRWKARQHAKTLNKIDRHHPNRAGESYQ